MKIDLPKLQHLATDILIRQDMSEDDAHIVTDILLEAELRGHATHGLIRLPGIVTRIRSTGRRPMKLSRNGGAHALIDGQENLGYLVAHRCARTAVGKADKTGVGIVGAFNTSHCGMLSYYTTMIADAGLVGLAMCNTSPRMAPWGGIDAVLGSNPISAAFPARNGQIVVDLSTAAITNGQILMAAKNNTPIPDNCALGPDGRLTTDPKTARQGAALPFGGHKGYALAMLIQVFSGTLVRAAAVPEPGKNYGIFMLALSPTIFLERELFQDGIAELIDHIKTTRTAENIGEILIPGERAFREREIRTKEGIHIDDDLWQELQKL